MRCADLPRRRSASASNGAPVPLVGLVRLVGLVGVVGLAAACPCRSLNDCPSGRICSADGTCIAEAPPVDVVDVDGGPDENDRDDGGQGDAPDAGSGPLSFPGSYEGPGASGVTLLGAVGVGFAVAALDEPTRATPALGDEVDTLFEAAMTADGTIIYRNGTAIRRLVLDPWVRDDEDARWRFVEDPGANDPVLAADECETPLDNGVRAGFVVASNGIFRYRCGGDAFWRDENRAFTSLPGDARAFALAPSGRALMGLPSGEVALVDAEGSILVAGLPAGTFFITPARADGATNGFLGILGDAELWRIDAAGAAARVGVIPATADPPNVFQAPRSPVLMADGAYVHGWFDDVGGPTNPGELLVLRRVVGDDVPQVLFRDDSDEFATDLSATPPQVQVPVGALLTP